jgi:hypothetical protein
MRKTGTITINDKVITINELTVKQILTIKDELSGTALMDIITKHLPFLIDVEPEFLMELAPSDLEEIYDKVKEVNGSFFRVIPLDKMLAGYQETALQTITSGLSKLSVQSLAPATA